MTIQLPAKVKAFIADFQKKGWQCYAVGGSVRDILLGRETEESKRFDFATNATPEEIQRIFPGSFYDNTFGTVGVKIKDKDGNTSEIYEVTTFRKEGKYSDARHPDKVVWAKTIEEDLARREFTVSAIATDGKKIVDPYNGRKDLKDKIIRSVGDPLDRFREDALRLLRAIRISTQLSFAIEENTFNAIRRNSSQIQKISSERIRDELIKILSSDYPADGIKLLHNAGLLEYILPELVKGIGVSQKGTHHANDVFEHSLESLRHCQNKNWVVRLATLLHDIGKPVTYQERNGKATFYNHEVVGARIARSIASRLHFGKEDREKLFILVRWHMFSVSEFLTDAAVRRWIRRIGPENTTDMVDLRIADRLGSGVRATSWRLEKFKERVIEVQKHIPSVKDLAIDGHDVMKTLGLGPGPRIGQILSKLFEEIMEDPEKNERNYLLKRVEEISSQSTKSGAALKIEE